MSTINEVKEEMSVVRAVGGFTNALQQIAAMRMTLARRKVLAGRRFVDTAEQLMKELKTLQAIQNIKDIEDIEKHKRTTKQLPFTAREEHRAVIVITSDQGLNGKYNYDIYKKVQEVIDNKDNLYAGFNEADYFVIGKKGQEYFRLGKIKAAYFPYSVPENFEMSDLARLINMFLHYTNVLLIYSKYINTATHEVHVISLVTPPDIIVKDTNIYKKAEKDEKEHPKLKKQIVAIKQVGYEDRDIHFIFEPSLKELIEEVSGKLRAAAIRQEILDARLSHYAAQMIGMKAASDNAVDLSADLQQEYNKLRRKMIDKKISEVFAGINLW